MLNEHRLSVQMLENFYEGELNDLLKKQYQVDGLEGIRLSPRAHRDGDSFESCPSCDVSLRPNQAPSHQKPQICNSEWFCNWIHPLSHHNEWRMGKSKR